MKSIKTMFLFAMLLASSSVFASDILSNGIGGGLWSEPSSWVGGRVPTNGDNVVIVGNDIIVVNQDVNANNIIITNSATIQPDNAVRQITIANDLHALNNSKIEFSNNKISGKLNWNFTGLADGKSEINIARNSNVIFNNLSILGPTNISESTLYIKNTIDIKSRYFTVSPESVLNVGE